MCWHAVYSLCRSQNCTGYHFDWCTTCTVPRIMSWASAKLHSMTKKAAFSVYDNHILCDNNSRYSEWAHAAADTCILVHLPSLLRCVSQLMSRTLICGSLFCTLHNITTSFSYLCNCGLFKICISSVKQLNWIIHTMSCMQACTWPKMASLSKIGHTTWWSIVTAW